MYVYQADLFCDYCGEDMCDSLKDNGIEDDGDSGTYPQYHNEEDSLTDSPNHCASESDCKAWEDLRFYGMSDTDPLRGAEDFIVGELLAEGLTEQGEQYVLDILRACPKTPYQAALHVLWVRTYSVGVWCVEADSGNIYYAWGFSAEQAVKTLVSVMQEKNETCDGGNSEYDIENAVDEIYDIPKDVEIL